MKVIVFLLFIYISEGIVLPSIPSHLQECYQRGAPEIRAPKRLDVFLSLLRKLEMDHRLDMRMFSGSLLRSLRLDGIEEAANAVQSDFVLPFRASAFQFNKYKVLMDLFIPTLNQLEVNASLTVSDKCLLHRMMSSTVRRWERGDESLVCPLSSQQRQNMATSSSGRIHSRCPIEEGVIYTDWGTIAPGTLVSAIAASLEQQRVLVTDILNADVFKAGISEPVMASAKQEWYENIEAFNADPEPSPVDISNVWVATLAGDLAEVIVNQGPLVGAAPGKLVVGTNNRWNDTFLPRDFYLLPQNVSEIDWHFTDAEILAGVDGLIIANYLPLWYEQRKSLRLSQVLDMYYSHEGVSFNTSVRACNRQSMFNDVFRRETLLAEASRFARVLSLRQTTGYVPAEEVDRIADAAVTAFVNYIPNLLRRYHVDCRVSSSVPLVDMVVATDGAWSRYEVEQFMSWLGGALEVNLQQTSLSLLHGNTGHWIVPPSSNLTDVFYHISNFSDSWPNRLNLPNVISTITQYSRNRTLEEADLKRSGGLSTVVLVVSPVDQPSGTELTRAAELMQSLRTSFFDVYFAYVARSMTDFQTISGQYMDYSEMFLTVTSSTVSSVIEAVDNFIVNGEVPTRLFGELCPFNGTTYEQMEYEDSVLPNRVATYRIHPYYLRRQPLVTLRIRNDGQGTLLACTWRGADASHLCHTIAERDLRTFNLTDPCPSTDFCPPAYFSVTPATTSNLCAHNDCRLPHQVGYYMMHSGLRCLPLRNSSNVLISNLISIYLLISIIKFVNTIL